MANRRKQFLGGSAAMILGFGAIAVAAEPPTTKAPPAKTAAKQVPANAAGPRKTIDARPWPRQYLVDGVAFSIYRPQIDTWSGNRLAARAVMAVKTGETKDEAGNPVSQQIYGVMWLTARTETDKLARELILDQLVIDKVNFPTAKDKEAAYLALARKVSPTTEQVVSLNQVEAALALNASGDSAVASRPVDNDPPEIIFAFQPSVLVLIDGQPVFRPSIVAGVERVINTRAVLFRHQGSFYASNGGKWSTAVSLDGPWGAMAKPPPAVLQAAAAAQKAAASEPKPPAGTPLKAAAPQVIVRTKRAELITVEGDPVFAEIAGTSLKYVSNTPADVLIDGSGAWYVAIAGRWFSGPSSKGPWRYVDPTALPAEFAKIPGDSPKSAVLALVPGTPEAKEALVANAVPQTATVNRREAKFEAKYDGEPQFKPIETTSITYAANSQAPVLRVGAGDYYAVENGVWFTAKAPRGPWIVATSVPDEIYKIPSWSALHYVTYAYVYGSDGDEIYVGYTPGYYGTVVSKGVVVYGTGYPCASWVGNTWYGCPTPYGYGAAFGYASAVGWSLTFGWGWYDPWYDPWWGPWGYYGYGYYPGGYYPGYYGGAVAGNVYGRWGNSVVAGTAAAWANPYTGNYGRAGAGGYANTVTGGRGYGYAGRNTNIYTGNSTAAAGGIRYNPQTGRVVSGSGGSISNIYTGEGVAGGSRTVTNSNTGRTTQTGGVAARGDQGAGAAGGFRTTGPNGGSAAGAGYVHYDRASGDVSRGGVANINGDIYAGKDGNVYKRNDDGSWAQAGEGGRFSNTDRPDQSLDRERLSRDRGYERDRAGDRGFERSASTRPSFDRGSYGGASRGQMGGMRGGGFRGGGGRRR
jgi:hypothetical protein